jgi:CTP:molybdopterin cytidylyltransferase MocA
VKVAAVVLAAGSSRRLGRPKQEVRLGGETLLERTVRVAHLASLCPLYVVLAASHAAGLDGRVTVLRNPDAGEGMAASIRVGVAAAVAAGVCGVVILACDQPAVTAEHLRAIAKGQNEVIASEYAGRKGVPAYFPASVFGELLKLRGDIGARELLRSARALPLPHGELDIDTEDDLARAGRLYESGDAEAVA